jgi:secondary thiamine-phosphate synthase enzyme
MPFINLKTSLHSEMVDITKEVSRLIPEDMRNGLCCIYSLHTTAAITINENADPDVCSDMVKFMEQMVPWNESMFRHFEGNSAAHIKSSLMGFSQIIPVENGRLVLGTWQGIYFCEYDGPRSRKVHVTFIEDKA